MRRRNKAFAIICLLLCVVLGSVIMAYPLFASWYTEEHRSEVRVEYQAAVREVRDTSGIDETRAAAEEYNRRLLSGQIDPLEYDTNGYMELLDPLGNGIMGYVRIDKIGVELPVYHTTEASVMDLGAGHMPQTSLPIGGENSHAVISAHSGMAGSPMFSDLELLEVGDVFQIEILGEVLTYEVDQIKTVLPTQLDDIRIVRGEDLCTLLTCTPYGVNTHRLLVRGRRIPTPKGEETAAITETAAVGEDGQSVWLRQYRRAVTNGVLIALAIALMPVAALSVRSIWRKRKKGGTPGET